MIYCERTYFSWFIWLTCFHMWTLHVLKYILLLTVTSKKQFLYCSPGINCTNVYSPSVQFSSVVQSCPTLFDPMNHSTPGLPVQHQLPEFTQTHIHRISDAIQPSHPLSSPSPPAPNPSQCQSLFQWVNRYFYTT